MAVPAGGQVTLVQLFSTRADGGSLMHVHGKGLVSSGVAVRHSALPSMPDCTPEVQAALAHDPAQLAKICAATPWLLPPRSPVFAYSGISDEEQLLALRSQPYRQYNRTISIFEFSRATAVLTQNCVYTLVRFAGVTNYLALTWTPGDHAACLDLNLPCWDVSRLLPWPVAGGYPPAASGSTSAGAGATSGSGSSDGEVAGGEEGGLAHFGSSDFNAITWLGPRVVAWLLERGYVVHSTDVDVAYSTKPLWASYLRYIEDGGADGTISQESSGGANTGNYVLLPTPAAKAFTRKWADAALPYKEINDQWGLGRLQDDTRGQSHTYCWLPSECDFRRKELGTNKNNTALLRYYQQPWTITHPDPCFLNNPDNIRSRPVDPCHYSSELVLYIHPICAGGEVKLESLKAARFWFVDDQPPPPPPPGEGNASQAASGSASAAAAAAAAAVAAATEGQSQQQQQHGSGLARLPPLRWRLPHVEDALWECVAAGMYPLAFTYLPLENGTHGNGTELAASEQGLLGTASGGGARQAGKVSALAAGLQLLGLSRSGIQGGGTQPCPAYEQLRAAKAEVEAARWAAEQALKRTAAAQIEVKAARQEVQAFLSQQGHQQHQEGTPAAADAAGEGAGVGGASQGVPSSASGSQHAWQEFEPQGFTPRGYQMPQECAKHQVLYPAAFDLLRPWMASGIHREDIDSCGVAPAATADFSTGEFTSGGHASRFRLLLWNNTLLVTSGGLRREGLRTGLDYFMLAQIQEAARRFGLPNMELVVGWADLVGIERREGGRLCPLLAFCKRPENYDILVPDGHFIQHMYDDWVERVTREDPIPWAQKEEKAVGRWHGYCPVVPPVDRHGNKMTCPRQDYQRHWNDTGGSFTSFQPEWMSLSQQRMFKYTLSTDGLGCSPRFQKVLATGQAVIKHDSISGGLIEFFYPALKPWLHYVPVGAEGTQEIDAIVQFLAANDDLARAIGREGQRFAATHLTAEGRLCYLKVLFEELAKLLRYETPPPETFPSHIPFDNEYNQYAKDQSDVGIRPEG
ncbi:hypothetical protein N2152v2_000931 [Parachlorella kessleri]